MRIDLKLAIAVLVYAISGFLTSGYITNHRSEVCERESTFCAYLVNECVVRNSEQALWGGIFWPAYWSRRVSLWVTK